MARLLLMHLLAAESWFPADFIGPSDPHAGIASTLFRPANTLLTRRSGSSQTQEALRDEVELVSSSLHRSSAGLLKREGRLRQGEAL